LQTFSLTWSFYFLPFLLALATFMIIFLGFALTGFILSYVWFTTVSLLKLRRCKLWGKIHQSKKLLSCIVQNMKSVSWIGTTHGLQIQ
jgi:hypothetical protein